MTINFLTLQNYLGGLGELASQQLPFKLSLIIAKNISVLEKENEFYIEREREFAQKYLVMENGQFVREGENSFRIKDGMQEECREARETLDHFEVDVELRKIPASSLETLEIAPKTLLMIEELIDEEA